MIAVAFEAGANVPTKRRPLRGTVRISLWSSPLSPIALRAALMRLVSVESDTIRPPQTEAMRSSLLTTRSRFSMRWTRRSNTCGSTEIDSEPRQSSRRSVSSTKSAKTNCTTMIQTRQRPGSRGIIKPISSANQAPRKAFRPPLRQSSSLSIAIPRLQPVGENICPGPRPSARAVAAASALSLRFSMGLSPISHSSSRSFTRSAS